jgi:hypothetical protein
MAYTIILSAFARTVYTPPTLATLCIECNGECFAADADNASTAIGERNSALWRHIPAIFMVSL